VKVLLLLFVLFLCMFGSAWGQGPKPILLAELAKYMGANRERVLYDGAQRESKIVWYTSLVPHKEIAKVFEAKYPGVTVETYRSDGTDLSNRLLAETQAKRYIADAIETTPGPLMPLRDNQVLLLYNSPYLAGYPDIAKEKASGGLVYWTTDRESLNGVGYNKNVLPAADVPKKFDDLLRPALRGKMSTANNETGARSIGTMLISPEGQKMFAEKLFYGSAAKDYGFERWYPEKGLSTTEYQERADQWLKLLREITRK